MFCEIFGFGSHWLILPYFLVQKHYSFVLRLNLQLEAHFSGSRLDKNVACSPKYTFAWCFGSHPSAITSLNKLH